MVIKIVLVLLLVACSALFSSCETAFSSVNKIRLKHIASQEKEKKKKAECALHIANQFEKALTAILIGNNIVNILSASLGTIIFTTWFGNSGIGISTAVMTILVLIFGEILPKSYAKSHAEQCALFFATPLSVLIWILMPAIFVFQKISALVASEENIPSVTEDELKVIIDEIEEEGVLEEQEGDLVRAALEFDETKIKDILIPRVNLIAIDKDMPLEEIKQIFLTERYSRLPVYEDSIDNVIGILTSMSFFRLLDDGETDLKKYLRPVLRFPESTPISNAFSQMQKSKNHMAIVLDQYGGTDGIVTLEDIIEELVGEIYDENDEVIPQLTQLAEKRYEVMGALSINDFLEKIDLEGVNIETESITLAGWAMELFERVPKNGEQIETDFCTLMIKEADEQHIEKLIIELKENLE